MGRTKKPKYQATGELDTVRLQVSELGESRPVSGLTEKRFQETEERYRLLPDNVIDVIWTMDMNYRMTYVSPSVARLRGYSVEEVMRQSLEGILTPVSLDLVMKALSEELAIEATDQKDLFRHRTLDLEYKCKDGSTVWAEVRMTFLRDKNNHPVGILGVTRDIGERKRAKLHLLQTKQFLENLINAAADAIIYADADGIVRVWNPAAERLYGFTAEEALGKSIFSLPIPEDRREEAEQLRRSLTVGSEVFQTQRRRKDGSLVWVSISNSPLFDRAGTYTGGSYQHS